MGFTAETGQTLTQTHFNFSWRIIVNSTRSANSINAPINPSSDFEIWFALHPVFPAWLVSKLWRVLVRSSSHSAAAPEKQTLFLASGLREGLKRSWRMNKCTHYMHIQYMFSSAGKRGFFFFLVIFISSPGKQKDKKPTAGWLFKPSLLRHLFKFPETDTDVLHHLHFKCVWVSPEAGSTARGCDQTSITGKRHEQANIRLPGSSRMKKHTSVTVEASLKHSWGALSLL